MKRKMFLFLALMVSIFIVGCVPQKMYYFGDYSQTLYSFEKNQTEETLINHKQELEKIITESEVRNLPVPPGIYAELGYIDLKANNLQKAVNLFQAESKLYPESKYFMDRLIQSSKVKEDTESDVFSLSTSKDTTSN